jgi:hypothetical protein
MLFTMALTAPCASKLSLPASLRIFQSHIEAPDILQKLPPHLKSLVLLNYGPRRASEFQPVDWMQLPTGITSLECSSSLLGPPESLGSLRRLSNLKHLIMTIDDPWLSKSDLNPLWPSSIEVLRLHGVAMKQSQWLASLCSMPLLKTLKLHGRNVPPDIGVDFGLLPRWIEELAICWFPSNGFSGLPDALISLSVLPSNLMSSYSLQSMSNLPPNLSMLQLRGAPEQTSEVVALLPPRISTLIVSDIPDEGRTNLYRQYYSRPIWEGVMDRLFQTD